MIIDRLQHDIKQAMKARDMQLLKVLRTVSANIKQFEVDQQQTADDKTITKIIQHMVKQRKDALAQFDAANREDLSQQEAYEITLLHTYLPEQLSTQALTERIQKAIVELNASEPRDIGRIIAHLRPEIEGKADMKEVSGLINKLLKQPTA